MQLRDAVLMQAVLQDFTIVPVLRVRHGYIFN